jgi:hypothetical protein
MPTVTYHHQPGIHATRGTVPLAGTEHVYTVSKILWPKAVENYLKEHLISPTLHICCGLSTLGDVLLDLYQEHIDVKANMTRLPFAAKSFNTVLIDPPYNGKFQDMHDMLSELSRVAIKRIIHQNWYSPVDNKGRYKKAHRFHLSEVSIWQPKTYFGRANVISIFDSGE